MSDIGLLHPGEMGAAVGAAAVGRGHTVRWASAGRSVASRRRAASAGLEDMGDLAGLLAATDMLLSICPPHAAMDVAAAVAAAGFSGLYVDCNAVSPDRARTIARTVEAAGASCVDGGIVGGPPSQGAGNTSLYLSGPRAKAAAACFDGSPLNTVIVNNLVGSASALKMGYAARTKGMVALLAAVLAMAESEGVREVLEGQWGKELSDEIAGQVGWAARRAWRFEGELHAIADTMHGAGLPDGFHRAGAEIYRRLGPFKDHAEMPSVVELLPKLLER